MLTKRKLRMWSELKRGGSEETRPADTSTWTSGPQKNCDKINIHWLSHTVCYGSLNELIQLVATFGKC
jgi:hypothetical protein